jgi:hypothetical protein
MTEEGKLSAEVRSEIRKLANRAWEKELRVELEKINIAFREFEKGEMPPQQVAQIIHEFHENTYRKLVEINESHEPVLLLGRAVVKGFVGEDEVPEDARGLLRRAVLFYRNKTSVFDKRPFPPDEKTDGE